MPRTWRNVAIVVWLSFFIAQQRESFRVRYVRAENVCPAFQKNVPCLPGQPAWVLHTATTPSVGSQAPAQTRGSYGAHVCSPEMGQETAWIVATARVNGVCWERVGCRWGVCERLLTWHFSFGQFNIPHDKIKNRDLTRTIRNRNSQCLPALLHVNHFEQRTPSVTPAWLLLVRLRYPQHYSEIRPAEVFERQGKTWTKDWRTWRRNPRRGNSFQRSGENI